MSCKSRYNKTINKSDNESRKGSGRCLDGVRQI